MRPAPWPALACLAVFLVAWGLSATDTGQDLDRTMLRELDGLPGAQATWAEASWPGGTIVTALVLLAGSVTAHALRQPRAGWAIAACGLVMPLVWAAKQLIARDRPDTLLAHGFALPSGHAALAVVAYGAVALLLVPVLRSRGAPPWTGQLLRGAWLGLAFAVGVARVAAGVHWPLDVLAGWAFGGAVLATAWWLAAPKPPEGHPAEPAPVAAPAPPPTR